MSSKASRENLTVRALVSNTEAEIIIGDRHANIHRVQEETGVYAGVSEAVRGVKDQILAVTGTVEGVVKAFSLVAYHLASLRVEPTDSSSESPLSPHPPTKLRILMPHRILPDVVGRDGKKIKAIQDSTGASLGVTGKMLLRSTECLVAVHGSPEAIGKAVEQIVMSVPKDSGFGKGTILFKPGTGDRERRARLSSEGRRRRGYISRYKRMGPSSSPQPLSSEKTQTSAPPVLETRKMSIPEDMVGYVLGRNRSNLAWIRRTARAKINLASQPTQKKGDDAERVLKIVGTALAVETAISLIEKRVERARRLRAGGWTGSRQGSQAREDEDEEQG
ncbi:hypothetical protein BD310DRAFT_950378 [Dichomitus squalens]|uniref:K Homology domain-containing protein n=1 Tax=Dichomitus squalens TaxID=114155 RepID=A0A4Q9PPD8_9APHY|nr:hypothetical protein BD310DRAFT_950378 [Dichomitus squalens]